MEIDELLCQLRGAMEAASEESVSKGGGLSCELALAQGALLDSAVATVRLMVKLKKVGDLTDRIRDLIGAIGMDISVVADHCTEIMSACDSVKESCDAQS